MLKGNLIVTLLLLFFYTATAQISTDEAQNNSSKLRTENNIEIRIGLMTKFTSENNFSIRGVAVKSGNKGLLGAVSYTRWLNNDLGLTVFSGLLNVSADVLVSAGSVKTQSATIIPFLFGVKYEPFEVNNSNKVTTYITALAGPVLGNATNVIINSSVTTQSISETAFGSFLGAGIDVSLSRLFMLGIRGGYYFVTDFKERVGFEKNYSSPEISASFGIVF
jgi:hypothetical protein